MGPKAGSISPELPRVGGMKRGKTALKCVRRKLAVTSMRLVDAERRSPVLQLVTPIRRLPRIKVIMTARSVAAINTSMRVKPPSSRTTNAHRLSTPSAPVSVASRKVPKLNFAKFVLLSPLYLRLHPVGFCRHVFGQRKCFRDIGRDPQDPAILFIQFAATLACHHGGFRTYPGEQGFGEQDRLGVLVCQGHRSDSTAENTEEYAQGQGEDGEGHEDLEEGEAALPGRPQAALRPPRTRERTQPPATPPWSPDAGRCGVDAADFSFLENSGGFFTNDDRAGQPVYVDQTLLVTRIQGDAPAGRRPVRVKADTAAPFPGTIPARR